jgi:hypothetical protein
MGHDALNARHPYLGLGADGGQPPTPRSLFGKMKMEWSIGVAHV